MIETKQHLVQHLLLVLFEVHSQGRICLTFYIYFQYLLQEDWRSWLIISEESLDTNFQRSSRCHYYTTTVSGLKMTSSPWEVHFMQSRPAVRYHTKHSRFFPNLKLTCENGAGWIRSCLYCNCFHDLRLDKCCCPQKIRV